eukprot:scaffold59530_cov68-Phaeocystis_antarctica.AAC.6
MLGPSHPDTKVIYLSSHPRIWLRFYTPPVRVMRSRVPMRLLAVAALIGVACGTSLRTVQKPTARTLDDQKMPLRFPTVPNSMRHFLASACSGAAGVTCLAPVEILRLSFMSKGETFKGAVASLGAPHMWFRGNKADTLSTALKVTLR